MLLEAWRHQYNTVRQHSSLGYRPPTPEVLLWPPPPATLRGAVPATPNQPERFNHETNYTGCGLRGACQRPHETSVAVAPVV